MGKRTKNDTVSSTPVEDAARLRELFKAVEESQTDFAANNGIGSQAMLWQFLNPENKGGRPLNLSAAVGFATGLNCKVKDFSPSLQAAIDRISLFASRKSIAAQDRADYAVVAIQTPAVGRDEALLIKAFRSATKDERRIMLQIAEGAIDHFKKRSETG